MLFDTHSHLADEKFNEDRENVIARMRSHGIGMTVCVADGARDPSLDFALAEKYPFIYAAVGVHPHDAKLYDSAREELLRTWLKLFKVVALGEIGLDYHYDTSPRDVQREVFARQICLAQEMQKPMIFHIREAHGDALDILRAHKGNMPSGVVHCYSGSSESAKEYMDLGFVISFTGSVTFKNASKLREVAKSIPLDKIMVETDCPYMTPEPLRGRRNEPAFVVNTAKLLAQIRGEDEETFENATTQNALRLFGIGEQAE